MFFACIFYRSGPIPFKIGGPRDWVCPERFPARLPRHSSLAIRKFDCTGERTRSGRSDPTPDDQSALFRRAVATQSVLWGYCDPLRACLASLSLWEQHYSPDQSTMAVFRYPGGAQSKM